MEETSVKGLHYIDVRDDKGAMMKAALEIKFKRIAEMVLTDTEIAFDELISDADNRRCRPGTLAFYLTKLARLGGHLARNVVIWRGLSRLTDIELGAAGNV